jgi:hypothetical protein
MKKIDELNLDLRRFRPSTKESWLKQYHHATQVIQQSGQEAQVQIATTVVIKDQENRQ